MPGDIAAMAQRGEPSRDGAVSWFACGTRPLAGLALRGPCASAADRRAPRQAMSSARARSSRSAVFVGVMGAALLSAIWLIRERARTVAENALLRARVADLNAALQRSEALLNLRDQRVVVWGSDHRKPELLGTLPAEAGAPEDRGAFLAFGRWLMPRSAAALEHAVVALRERSVGLRPVDRDHQSARRSRSMGRKTAQHVIVRFVSLSETPARPRAAEDREPAAARRPRAACSA